MKKWLITKTFFPEYNIKNLDLARDKFIIINRILEYGTLKQIKQLFKVYKPQEIKEFVLQYGAKKLSLKSLNFWCNFFDIKEKDKILNIKLKNKLWNF